MSIPGNSRTTKVNSRVNALLRFIDGINLLEGKLFSFLILLAALQICYELTLRYVFNAPTVWGLEMTVYLCGITYIMSGAFADRLDAHIRVDLFYNSWSPRTRAWINLVITDSIFIFFIAVLVWQSGIWLWEAVEQGLTSGTIWDIPIWPMRLFILLGASFLLLSAIGRIIRDFCEVLKLKSS